LTETFKIQRIEVIYNWKKHSSKIQFNVKT